jgi:hypothetical protein
MTPPLLILQGLVGLKERSSPTGEDGIHPPSFVSDLCSTFVVPQYKTLTYSVSSLRPCSSFMLSHQGEILSLFMSYLNLHFICEKYYLDTGKGQHQLYQRGQEPQTLNIINSTLHFEHQKHMESVFSELGKARITVNLGIFYSHKKYLLGAMTLDFRLQKFILCKFSNIYFTQVNQMYLETGRSRETRDHISCFTASHDLLPSPQSGEA